MTLLSERRLPHVVYMALMVAVVALAGLSTVSTRTRAEAAAPTVVAVFSSQAVGGTTTANGTSAINFYVDIDDANANTSVTDETLVTLTTNLGFWGSNGLQTVTVGCTIDDDPVSNTVGNAAPSAFQNTGTIPATVNVSNAATAAVSPEAETIAAGDTVSDTAALVDGAVSTEGCLGIDTTLTGALFSNTAGSATVTAIVTNGGAQASRVVQFVGGGAPTTTAAIFSTQPAGGTTLNDGLAAVDFYVDVDDVSGTIDTTSETLVSLTTNLGFWGANGQQSITIGCAIDDSGAGAGTITASPFSGSGTIPPVVFVSNAAAANVLPEADFATEAVADTTAPAAGGGVVEGCLGIDSSLAGGLRSNTAGSATVTALSNTGGATASTVVQFAGAGGPPSTTVRVFSTQAVNGSTLSNGVTPVNFYVDIDDTMGVPDVVNETLVTLTTNLGFWGSNGLQSVTTGCAIDDAGAGAGSVAASPFQGTGTIPFNTFVSDATVASVFPELESGTNEAGHSDAGLDATAGDANDGCIGIDTTLTGGLFSNIAGFATVTAIASNGGAIGSTVVRFAAAAGAANNLLVATDGFDNLAANIAGVYASPRVGTNMSTIVRDANNVSLPGLSVMYTVTGGGIELAGTNPPNPAACTAAAGVTTAAEVTTLVGVTNLSNVTWCASASALGEHTMTISVPGTTLTASRTVTFAGPPASASLSVIPLPSSACGAFSGVLSAAVQDAAAWPAADGTLVTFAASGAGSSLTTPVVVTKGGEASTGVLSTETPMFSVSASTTGASGALIIDGDAIETCVSSTGVDPSKSTVVASRERLPADGVTTVRITVTLRNSAGAPVSGHAVRLTQKRLDHSTISVASGLSNASGVVRFTATNTTPEVVVYTARDTTDKVKITQTARVRFR